jgi:hypothetical protein
MSSRLTWFGRLYQKSFGRLDPKLTNSRCEDRIPIQKLVHVSWHDRYGNVTVNGTLRNISEKGTAMESTDPMCTRIRVLLHMGPDKVVPAVVRYCIPRGEGYEIGMEFTDACI